MGIPHDSKKAENALRFSKPTRPVLQSGEPIPDLQLCDEMSRTCRVVFELLSEVSHIKPDVMRSINIAWSSNVEQQLPVSENLPMAADERCEKSKFYWRKR